MSPAEPLPEIAAAVVVHQGKVLMIRRRVKEGDLLWAFPSGAIESGESGLHAAVRECEEELGIRTVPREEIGFRVHPHTGRVMRYCALTMASNSPHPEILDTEELDSVGFFDLKDADLLTNGSIFEPVRDFIQSETTNN